MTQAMHRQRMPLPRPPRDPRGLLQPQQSLVSEQPDPAARKRTSGVLQMRSLMARSR
jgi:hypothetical protein